MEAWILLGWKRGLLYFRYLSPKGGQAWGRFSIIFSRKNPMAFLSFFLAKNQSSGFLVTFRT